VFIGQVQQEKSARRGTNRETFARKFEEHRMPKSLALAVLLFVPVLVAAQSDSGSASALVKPASVSASSTSPVSVGSSGLIFSTADGADTLHVHGYVQADDRMFSSDVHGEPLDTFLFRRIRPLFEGTLFHSVDYRFMPDFGQYNPQIQESYLEWKSFSFAKLRVGKFKEPIGLEVLRSDRQLTFVERSLASDLVPLRYMGAELGGSILSESITYQVGYFNGSSDGSNGNFQWVQANELAARLFTRPFALTHVGLIRQFGLGMGGSFADQHGPLAGLKTVGQTTFFKYSSKALANGDHSRISPQAFYYAGPVGVLGEYVRSSQDILYKGVTRTVTNTAWEATGSVMLTGERNSYEGIRPRNAFEPTKGFRHLGAVELAVRYSQLRIGNTAFPLLANPKTAPGEAQERGIGVNWYLNRFVKLTTDYEHTNFRMVVKTATPLHSEDLLMSQVQLAF
jgi:phosphate-selective porin OprO and OprP